MKKMLLAIAAIVLLSACGAGTPQDLQYRGLSMKLPFNAFVDSLRQRGFAVDSAHSDSAMTQVAMANPSLRYRLMMVQKDNALIALQENYLLSTNDSTRNQWQKMRDDFEKELGTWPNCPELGDDHKVAKFETEGGFITLTLKNTYTPTLSVRYDVKQGEK